MSVPFWVAELAAAFWANVGEAEAFPRNLRRPIARGTPLAVVTLPQLHLVAIQDWLSAHGLMLRCGEPDRALRACLLAVADHGFVFLDGSDPDDEQRLSLAHELAHFLRHYWSPRLRTATRLGERTLEVFDGVRPPTLREALHSLLAGIPLGYHAHLMHRDATGAVVGAGIDQAESEADLLAYELLAPAETVLSRAVMLQNVLDQPTVATVLHEFFGLPAAYADSYARLLVPEVLHDPLLRRLGLV